MTRPDAGTRPEIRFMGGLENGGICRQMRRTHASPHRAISGVVRRIYKCPRLVDVGIGYKFTVEATKMKFE